MPGRRNNRPARETVPGEERRPDATDQGGQTPPAGSTGRGNRPQRGGRSQSGRAQSGRSQSGRSQGGRAQTGPIPRTGSDQDNRGPEGQPHEGGEQNNPNQQNNRGQRRGYRGQSRSGQNRGGQNRGNPNRREPGDRVSPQPGHGPQNQDGPENTGDQTAQGASPAERGQKNPRQQQRRDGRRRDSGPRNQRQSNQPRSQYRNEGGMTTRDPDTEQITRGPQENQGPSENAGFERQPDEQRPDNRGPNNRRQGGRGGQNGGQNRGQNQGQNRGSNQGQNRGQNRGRNSDPNRGQPSSGQPAEMAPSDEGTGRQSGDQPRYGDQPRRGGQRRDGGPRSNRGRYNRPELPGRVSPDAPASDSPQGSGEQTDRDAQNNRDQQGNRGQRGQRGGRSSNRNSGRNQPGGNRSASGGRSPRGDRPAGGQNSGAEQGQSGGQKSPSRRKPNNQHIEHAPYIPANGEVIIDRRRGDEARGADTGQNQRPPRGERRPRGERAPRQRENGYERGEGYYSFTGYNFDRPAPTVPIRTNQGIKSRSQRGTFSKNWWARRWIESMEQLVDPGRLQRGRSYARSGQVLSIDETQHGIAARVQGSRPKPYDVSIQVTPLTDQQWDQVIDALSEQAIFTAQLLAGEMPSNIEDAFNTAKVSLFPSHAGDLFTSCSCPDWANPCKHVAATHYILGDRFDDDPFLLFRMRGRSQEQILQALRARRAGQSDLPVEEAEPEVIETEAAQPLEDVVEHFWEPIEPLDTFPLTIRPPSMDMPLLMRLGDPAFLVGESLQDLLKPVYDTFTRSALRAAYSEEEPLEPSNGDSADSTENSTDDADIDHS